MNGREVTKMTLNDMTSLRNFLMQGLHASSNDEVEIQFSEGKAIIALPAMKKSDIIKQVAGKIPLTDPFMTEVLRSRKAEEDRDA
jgi:antitoxin component of MazEF toxin-antitoxin module